MALAFEQQRIVLPRPDLAPELIDELESFEYSVTESGNVKMSAPSGVHDDTVIALALAAWQPTKVKRFRREPHFGMGSQFTYWRSS